MRAAAWWVVVAVAAGSACGDPETSDERGYTKAPLENPGLLVEGEEATAMATLGTPDRTEPELPETGASGPGAPAAGEAAEGESEATLAPGVTREQFDEGRQLFGGQGGCMACHGPNAGGSTLAPDLTDEEWLHLSDPTVDALAELIANGVPQPQEYPAPMPPMGGASLNDQQVRALAAYVASLGQG
jgi:mono/diheme cytochrome c family protein